MGEALKILTKKRGCVKGKLTLCKRYLDGVLEIKSRLQENECVVREVITELQGRLEKAENLLSEFDLIQNEIELSDENIDEQIQEREAFENNYFKITSTAKCIISENCVVREVKEDTLSQHNGNNIGQGSVGPALGANSLPHIKMPQIKLPIFKGSYETWLEFRDTFMSLVHKRPDLDDIEKFHYVRAHLEGEAKQVIHSLEFSAENYKVAWELLCERYDNKRMLVHNHLKSLTTMSAVKSKSASDLREMSDNISRHIRALKQSKLPAEHWDILNYSHVNRET